MTKTAVFGGLMLAIGAGLVTLNLMTVLNKNEFEPFRKYTVPQKVLGPKIIEPGGAVITVGTKCYRTKYLPLTFTFTVVWRRQDTQRTILLYRQGVGTRGLDEVGPDGCVTRRFDNVIDPAISDGPWRIEGQECAQRGRETTCVGWYTDTFVVKPLRG